MITAANLKTLTVKDLGQMAKEHEVAGWHTMRKDELVKALVRKARSAKARKARATAKSAKTTKASAKTNGRNGKASTSKGKATSRTVTASKNGRAKAAAKTNPRAPAKTKAAKTVKAAAKTAPRKKPVKKAEPKKPSNPRVARKLAKLNGKESAKKDLSSPPLKLAPIHGSRKPKTVTPKTVGKDRLVLLVRDPYWLQACWDVSRNAVLRAQAAMAENWHSARPVLRIYEVESSNTTSAAERVVRNIEIHGGVRNWFIDVDDPPKSYRAELGYLADNGKFFALSRSNTVDTPRPGSSDAIDSNWTDVAENYEKIYALSGGYSDQRDSGELQELFEERLRRPMGAPMVTRYGVGAEAGMSRQRDFVFDVDAEMIIYGHSKADAHVTLAGDPVKLRRDGTFTVRLSMPDKRQVIPVVASSSDGVEQRTIVLAVERNTKVMEPMIRDNSE